MLKAKMEVNYITMHWLTITRLKTIHTTGIYQWRGKRYDGTSTRTGLLQSKKIKNRIER